MLRTGLSAWIMANALNKMPADVILEDDNRLYSFMILLKRVVRSWTTDHSIETDVLAEIDQCQALVSVRVNVVDGVVLSSFDALRIRTRQKIGRGDRIDEILIAENQRLNASHVRIEEFQRMDVRLSQVDRQQRSVGSRAIAEELLVLPRRNASAILADKGLQVRE